MKRFDMEIEPERYYMGEGESYAVFPYESTNGDWVKWDDVQELIETLKDARLVVDSVCDEYRGYLVTLRKIDKVLNNIEGAKQ